MTLLASAAYDPAAAVTKATTAASVMAAMDTTNLRLTFTVPANGNLLVRLRGTVHGATTFPQILLGVLEGATVRLRQAPLGSLKTTALATSQLSQEVLAVVPGMTPGASLTWDAAWGSESAIASTGVKYGGPNDAVGNDAFGAFVFEVYDTPNLLAAKLYDPAGAATIATTGLLAMTAIDTTNLRNVFTATTTKVLVRQRFCIEGATTMPVVLSGVLDGATVRARTSPVGGLLGTALATTRIAHESSAVVTGLTVGTQYTWDAAYAVQVLLAATNIKYGGPNNTTADDAWGAYGFECWSM